MEFILNFISKGDIVILSTLLSVVIIKLFGENLFKKDLEKYKTKLKIENSNKLEEIKKGILIEIKNEERAYKLEIKMNNYKSPLLHAINDLQSRLYNILFLQLCKHYGQNENPMHNNYVVNNTAFLYAQYFAWVEIIRNEIQFIELKDSNSVRSLSDQLDSIYSAFLTDKFDDELFIWAGEQRGIGELLIKENKSGLTCMGYASFLEVFKNTNNILLTSLKIKTEKIVADPIAARERLISLQHALIDVMRFLDPDYNRFPENKRQKA